MKNIKYLVIVRRMGYLIDISFDFRKKNNITSTREMIINMAYEYNCITAYDTYEFQGRRHSVHRSSCVISIEFNNESEDDLKNIIQFLKSLKSIKNIHIESVFCDSPPHFVYTSTKYQNMMENKKIAAENRKRKRERLYSNEDLLVLDAMSK